MQVDVTWADDRRGNCHWFTFRHYVCSADIECLLINDYQPVQHPQPGDAVIYRNERGRVNHSGLVGHDGLIQSKWGNSPIVLHSVEDCPYGDRVSYYRRSYERIRNP